MPQRRSKSAPSLRILHDPDDPMHLLTYTERVMCQPDSMDDLMLHRAVNDDDPANATGLGIQGGEFMGWGAGAHGAHAALTPPSASAPVTPVVEGKGASHGAEMSREQAMKSILASATQLQAMLKSLSSSSGSVVGPTSVARTDSSPCASLDGGDSISGAVGLADGGGIGGIDCGSGAPGIKSAKFDLLIEGDGGGDGDGDPSSSPQVPARAGRKSSRGGSSAAQTEESQYHSNVSAGSTASNPSRFASGPMGRAMCQLCERYYPVEELEEHSDFCLCVNQYDVKYATAAEELREVLGVIAVPYFRYARADVIMQLNDVAADNKLGINDRIFDALGPLVRAAQALSTDAVPSYAREFVAGLEKELGKIKRAIEDLSRCSPCDELSSACDAVLAKAELVVRLGISGASALEMLAPSEAALEELQGRETVGLYPSIDSFEVIKPLSQGNFGQVLLARKKSDHPSHRRGKQGQETYYAIKVLQRGKGVERNQLTAEQRILAKTHNDFVVKMLYSFETEGNFYFVMEYMSGGDTLSLLQNVGAFADEMTQAYAAEIVLALEYLHNMGIVHRDLKPDNIMIGGDGHLSLTDFGLSSYDALFETYEGGEAEAAQKKKEKADAAVGTPDYVAPEVLLKKPHGPPVDWWALGVIIYEFTTGCPPFNAEDVQTVFSNILARRIEWPDEEDMSPECKDLVSKLLVLDPAKRLTAKEVKAHPFFEGIEWDSIKISEAIWVPELGDMTDTSYFDPRGADAPVAMDATPLKEVSTKERLSGLAEPEGTPKQPKFAFKNLAALVNQNEATIERAKRSKTTV